MSEFNSTFRKAFNNIILNDLFLKYNAYLVEEKDEIFQLNNTANGLLTSAHTYFFFIGKIFTRDVDEFAEEIRPVKTDLIPELQDRMQEFITASYESDNEYRAILAYVRRLLNLSNSIEDIYLLWPKELNEYWTDALDNSRLGSIQTIRSEVIEEFKIQTQNSIVYIKERKFKNLLIQ